MNFVINDDSDDSELKLPELNDSLAKYVRRHERQQNARSGKLFNVAPDINSALFNVHMVSKQETHQTNRETVPEVTASNRIALPDDSFARPLPMRQVLSTTGMNGAAQLNELTEAIVPRAAGMALEQTINDTNCKFEMPTECHSTPYHGPEVAVSITDQSSNTGASRSGSNASAAANPLHHHQSTSRSPHVPKLRVRTLAELSYSPSSFAVHEQIQELAKVSTSISNTAPQEMQGLSSVDNNALPKMVAMESACAAIACAEAAAANDERQTRHDNSQFSRNANRQNRIEIMSNVIGSDMVIADQQRPADAEQSRSKVLSDRTESDHNRPQQHNEVDGTTADVVTSSDEDSRIPQTIAHLSPKSSASLEKVTPTDRRFTNETDDSVSDGEQRHSQVDRKDVSDAAADSIFPRNFPDSIRSSDDDEADDSRNRVHSPYKCEFDQQETHTNGKSGRKATTHHSIAHEDDRSSSEVDKPVHRFRKTDKSGHNVKQKNIQHASKGTSVIISPSAHHDDEIQQEQSHKPTEKNKRKTTSHMSDEEELMQANQEISNDSIVHEKQPTHVLSKAPRIADPPIADPDNDYDEHQPVQRKKATNPQQTVRPSTKTARLEELSNNVETTIHNDKESNHQRKSRKPSTKSARIFDPSAKENDLIASQKKSSKAMNASQKPKKTTSSKATFHLHSRSTVDDLRRPQAEIDVSIASEASDSNTNKLSKTARKKNVRTIRSAGRSNRVRHSPTTSSDESNAYHPQQSAGRSSKSSKSFDSTSKTSYGTANMSTSPHHIGDYHAVELHETISETQPTPINSLAVSSSISPVPNTVSHQWTSPAQSNSSDDHAAVLGSDVDQSPNETFQSDSTNNSARSFTVCASVVEPSETHIKATQIADHSPQPSTSAVSKRRNRKKQHVPTMNSWDYHPYDRTEIIDEGLNVRRSSRAPCPRKKYWSNTIELWSPVILPESKYAKNKSTSRQNNSQQKRLIAQSNGSNSSTNASTETSKISSTIDGTSLVFSAGMISDMFEGTFVSKADRLSLLQNVDGIELIGDKNSIKHTRSGNVDYWLYDRLGVTSMGYMKFNPTSKKKMSRANESLDINVMFGVLSITIGDVGELDYEAGVVIRINKGIYYKMRNRYEAITLAYFCTRHEE